MPACSMMLYSHSCRYILISVQTNVGKVYVHYLYDYMVLLNNMFLEKGCQGETKIKIPLSVIL